MVRFITVEKMAAESGYTEKAIRNKCHEGIWPKDQVWRKAPDGRILIDIEGYEAWVMLNGGLNQALNRVSKSPFRITASAAESASRCRLQPLI